MSLTSHAGPESLPQELIDNIVDEIHAEALRTQADVVETLKTCTLISKKWLHRPQHHLFTGCFRISPQYPPYDEMEQAVRFFKNNPKLAKNIHGVALDFRLGSGENSNTFAVFESEHFQELFRIIHSQGGPLTTLKILGTSTNPDLETHIPVEDYNTTLDAYRQWFAPYITCLRIESLECVPIDLVVSCVNIKELLLFEVNFFSRSLYDWAGHTPPKLEKLGICTRSVAKFNNYMHLAPHGRLFDTSNLRSLTIYLPKTKGPGGVMPGDTIIGSLAGLEGSLCGF